MANIKFVSIFVISLLISLIIANPVLIIKKVGSITKQPPETKIPDEIHVPKGHHFKFLLYSSGSQTFVCNTKTQEWVFTFPNVTLVNDITEKQKFITKYIVADHFFVEPVNGGDGAIWKSIVLGDDSFVLTKFTNGVPSPDGPDNVNWVLLTVVKTGGHGAFSDNTFIYRVNTQGGQPPPVEQCGKKYKHGDEFRSEYLSEYWFFHEKY